MEEKLIAVPESLLTDIGDSIRAKRDITTPITVPDMPMQIGLIDGGGEGGRSSYIFEYTPESDTNEVIFNVPFCEYANYGAYKVKGSEEDFSKPSFLCAYCNVSGSKTGSNPYNKNTWFEDINFGNTKSRIYFVSRSGNLEYFTLNSTDARFKAETYGTDSTKIITTSGYFRKGVTYLCYFMPIYNTNI